MAANMYSACSRANKHIVTPENPHACMAQPSCQCIDKSTAPDFSQQKPGFVDAFGMIATLAMC
jgi:hypothetical protein